MSSPESAQDEPQCEYRRVVNAWAMYDWANSAFTVVILTAVFPVYYRALATNAGRAPEDATAYWAYTTSLSLLVVALIGPVVGAMADILGRRKRFLGVALLVGILGSASLALLGEDAFILGSLLFTIANLGFAGGNIFYGALLPHIRGRMISTGFRHAVMPSATWAAGSFYSWPSSQYSVMSGSGWPAGRSPYALLSLP